MTLELSRRLAIVFGLLLPVAETVRRWHQMGQLSMLPAWLDDYLVAGMLLYGAYRVARNAEAGQRFLAAAWGVACGMGYFSFFGQLARLDQADPAPIPASWVLAIKGVGLLFAIAALIGALRPLRPAPPTA